MANTAYRKPIIGGDLDAWGPFNDAFIRDTIGKCSVKLYDNAGALTVSKGRIGISDGIVEALCVIDTLTAVSLAAIGNSQWAEVYMTVAGTAVSFDVAAIAGATLADVIHATFTGAWDQDKGGYYINAARRCIGIVWKGSTGGLDGIINVNGDGTEGYNGYAYLESTQTQKMMWQKYKDHYRNWAIYQIGNWNMNATSFILLAHLLSATIWKKIRNIYITIRTDDESYYNPLTSMADAVDPNLLRGGCTNFTSTVIAIIRRAGSLFALDGLYNDPAYNRGWVFIELSE